MSFHGDVKGIGLAELLQSLAGGRRTGRLTLTVRKGQSLVFSLLQGRVQFLASEGEDSERWRSTAQDAWADEGDSQAGGLHMDTVAFGRHLEQCYAILDGSEVRFCFEPLPTSVAVRRYKRSSACGFHCARRPACGTVRCPCPSWSSGHGRTVQPANGGNTDRPNRPCDAESGRSRQCESPEL